MEKIFGNSNIKMISITDHNIFIYSRYLDVCKQFEKIHIKCLPGMELTIDGVHWIIIIDDNKLSENDIGNTFSKRLMSLINYNYGSDDLIELSKREFKVEDIISLLNDLEISFMAIPHLDKDKGYFKHGKITEDNLSIINSYIHNNIIFGFETKYHDEFFSSRMKKINESIKTLQSENVSQEKIDLVLKQINELGKIKFLNSAFIYGSDYHGNKDSAYKENEESLFYMKSDCSFEGLRFALLDYESRVFSNSKKEKYNKITNKILEYIHYSINGDEKYLYFGDGLNSFIGSRGTGKSYIIRSILNENSNYIESDIYNQIKILGIKLKSDSQEKRYLDKDNDADYIFQKNSSISTNSNLYNLLSEAPYDTEKFVKKIKDLSTNISNNNNLEKTINQMNECIKSYSTVNSIKTKSVDYSLLQKYNDFYKKIGNSYKIVEKLKNYTIFVEKKIEILILEIQKLDMLTENLNKTIELLEYTKTIKNYEYKNQDNLLIELKKILEANKHKNIVNNRNIDRLSNTKKLSDELLNILSTSTSNEENNFNVSFDLLKENIDELFSNMCLARQNTLTLKNNINKAVKDDEIVEIQRNNRIIKLIITKKADFDSIKISDSLDILKNYNRLEDNNKSIKYLFEDNYGQNYISEIYNKKDGRVTKGILYGYEFLFPAIIPTIFIEVNNQNYDLSKLSPGQKSSILLNLILDQDSNKILIIDQPEDDLDNETIYSKIVSNIRNLKLRRQIIIVSHNANLVINGDSDKIFVCYKDNKEYGIIGDKMESLKKYDYISINSPNLCDTILNISVHILEGGRLALANRVKKIGYKDIFLKEEINEN